MTGQSSTVPVIRRAARNSPSASLYFWVAYAAKPAGLTHGGDARGEPQRDPRVGVGLLGVLVDEVGDHHQVPGDVLSEPLGKALQLLLYVLVDLVDP